MHGGRGGLSGFQLLSTPGTRTAPAAVAIVPRDPDLRLRAAGTTDDAFFRHLFAATRAGAFVAAGLSGPMLAEMLNQQFRLQVDGHRQQFPEALIFVIARQNEPVGRLVLHCADLRWHVVDITLLPACCGQGVGSAVMAGIDAAARMHGIGSLTLTVLGTNRGARRFYACLGFTETGAAAGGAYLNLVKQLGV